MRSNVVESLLQIMQRTGASYSEIAAAAGLSPSTTRAVLLSGKLPGREHACERLERFVERNASATKREQLRFV